MSPQLLSTPAIDLLDRLRELYVERALTGRDADTAYGSDLDAEIAACRAAYVGTAVAEIATLRAQLSAPLQG